MWWSYLCPFGADALRQSLKHGLSGGPRSVDSHSHMLRMLRHSRSALLTAVCLGAVAVHAQDATWLANPGSGDWNTVFNWAPNTVPTGTATFGSSNTISITFSDFASV